MSDPDRHLRSVPDGDPDARMGSEELAVVLHDLRDRLDSAWARAQRGSAPQPDGGEE